MDVSIIIVNYNTKSLLKNCIASIYNQTKDISFEVIVSDNGSTDGSIEMIKSCFSQVILIENKENLGFGKANNNGLEIAKGKYILYLNSDTVLLNNAVKIFNDFWQEHSKENLGAIGCMLTDENGNLIHSYGTFPGFKLSVKQLLQMNITNIMLSFAYIFKINLQRPASFEKEYSGNVDYVTGADLFLLNNEYAKFNTDFFLYFEDSSLQKKLCNMNLQRRIIYGPKIEHLCGGSVDEVYNIKRKCSFSRIQFELSRILYLKNNADNSFLSKLLICICKLLVITSWSNPFLISKTGKYFSKIIKI